MIVKLDMPELNGTFRKDHHSDLSEFLHILAWGLLKNGHKVIPQSSNEKHDIRLITSITEDFSSIDTENETVVCLIDSVKRPQSSLDQCQSWYIENNKIIKVVDALGREVNHTTNQIIFYIYDDGTVEKKLLVH